MAPKPPNPPDRGRIGVHQDEESTHPPRGLVGGNSYAKVVRKKFPALTLDLSCDLEGERVMSQIVADFVFNDLLMASSEISRIVGIGKPNNVINIVTKSEVLVKERFGDVFEFRRQYGHQKWTCSIRGGGDSNSFVRLFHVPHELEKEDLIKALSSFATPLSGLMIEKFGKESDPRFAGIGSGHMRIRVRVIGESPSFIEVQKWRTKIWHKDQIKKCFHCGSISHLKASCPFWHLLFNQFLMMKAEMKMWKSPVVVIMMTIMILLP